MADYTKNLRITSSKKDCTCDETGVQIKKFEKVLFDPVNKKVYSSLSETFKNYAAVQLKTNKSKI